MTPTAHRAAVLGSPIAHSLSPVLHRAAYAELELPGWAYDAYDVDEAALPAFLDGLDGLDGEWAGLSLTMPLKAAVLPLLDSASAVVKTVGGANTVLLRDGHRIGENTDVAGLRAALASTGVATVDRAVLLGGGATARSAVAALAGLTPLVQAYVRTASRAAGLAATAGAVEVGLDVLDWPAAAGALDAPLVLNTTTAGAADGLAASVPARPGVLVEVLYDPWPTPLAAAWAAAGGVVVDGLELLVAQAVLQVGLMTGAAVDPARLSPILRAAGQAALAAS